MFGYFKKIKYEIITILLLYSTFLFIGIIVYNDFGISVDEWELRLHGFSNLIYLYEFLFKKVPLNIVSNEIIPKMSDYFGTHGPIFNLFTAFLEYFFNIEDSRSYYLMRHYINNLIFIIGNFYFYLLVKQRFNDWQYGLLGAIFLFCSPRIFAESFYNHKDIIFLSLFIISLYYGIRFYKVPSYKNIVLFSLFTALAIDIRIMGIIIIPIIIFFTYENHFENNKKIVLQIIIFLVLVSIFTIIFWPYLWKSPLINFYKVFKTFSAFGHEGYNFYLGSYHLSSNPPWHYILIWILATTPILYLFLFFYGFIVYSLRIFNNIKKYINNNIFKQLWNDGTNGEDFIYYILFILPILIVIILNSTLYTGWRHLFFIYPCFLIISIQGIHYIKNNYFKRKNFQIIMLLLIFISQIIFSMVKYHPHQNVYFNFLAGNKVEKLFELDYWGLANKQAFEYILENDERDTIKVGSAGPISLENSKKILILKDRNRILITENLKSDYIINNYIDWNGDYKKKRYNIPNNFNISKKIYANNQVIISIYKNEKN